MPGDMLHLPTYTRILYKERLLIRLLCHRENMLTQAYKGTVRPITSHEGPEGKQRYSSTLSLTPAIDEGGWLTTRPGRFTPEKKTKCPFCRELSGTQGWSGQVRKISPLPEFESRTVQHVASHYTD
jgi:hypothetical protein